MGAGVKAAGAGWSSLAPWENGLFQLRKEVNAAPLIVKGASSMSRFVFAIALAATAAAFAPGSGALANGGAHAPPADLPPYAQPGECFAKVVSEPTYASTSRKVLVKSGWSETVRTPRLTERVARRVLVRSARVERVRIEPSYRTETYWVERPGERQLVTEPARYETVREKVLIEAGHAEWRRQEAPLAYGETNSGQTMLQATGEIVCRIWVPARYGYSTRKVLVSSGRTYEVEGPPRQKKVTRTVQVSAGGWREKRIPAVYRTEYVTRVVREGRTRVVRHPAVYRTVRGERMVSPGGERWVKVVCAPQH
jgi:hypothetical protein